MPVHDWTLVDPGIFHHFHTVWTGRLSEELKANLPEGYYALAEQHLGRKQGDVLALHINEQPDALSAPEPPEGGGIAVAEAPPVVNRTLVASLKTKRRTLTIRHISGHQIIALVEILSPSNKSTANSVAEFIEKAAAALRAGIHVVLVDLFPPTKHDPHGIHAVLWDYVAGEEYILPEGKNLTLASYSAGSFTATAYVEHLAVGDSLKDMPLFLTSERYVNLPLNSTYEMTFNKMPDFWCNVLKGQS
jgi:Protein of unknown function (DUF4058)